MAGQPTRRAVLGYALAGAGAVGTVRAAESTARPATTASERPLPATSDPVLHAVRRLTFGPTSGLLDHVRALGVLGWLDEQLAITSDLAADTAAPGTVSLPLPYVAGMLVDDVTDQVAALQVATFARAAWGEAQVRELLVEFWSNHFSIAAELTKVGAHKLVDDRDVVRAHALGTFSDLLVASAQSPAMLLYLDNATSRGKEPNENYAREVLELHTVGVDGGYTQSDVLDAARVLTGLTVDPATGLFTYRSSWHYVGPVRVMGWSAANSDPAKGLAVAISLLRYLATHSSTARFLATKLVRRLVADDPPASLVASTAAKYLAAGTAIAPVVRHIVASKEFAASVGAKSQRPLDWFTAAVRALGLQPQPTLGVQVNGVLAVLRQLGQVPFAWVTPDGYPDETAVWASTATVLSRWNAAQALVAGSVQGLKPLNVDALVGTPMPATAGALVDRLVARLLGVAARPELRSAILGSASLAGSAAVDQAAVRKLAPAFAALILSSPEGQVR